MKKYDCKVILCGPAVGKTYLAEHDNRFVDVDGMRARYKYNVQNISDEEFEEGKYNRGEAVNHDSTEYAITLIKEAIDNNKIVLISYQPDILNYVINSNIDYCLVYADINLREEYKNRMQNRGNKEAFVDAMTNEKSWEEFYNSNENDTKPKYKIKLQKGQYLSDIKDYFA